MNCKVKSDPANGDTCRTSQIFVETISSRPGFFDRPGPQPKQTVQSLVAGRHIDDGQLRDRQANKELCIQHFGRMDGSPC